MVSAVVAARFVDLPCPVRGGYGDHDLDGVWVLLLIVMIWRCALLSPMVSGISSIWYASSLSLRLRFLLSISGYSCTLDHFGHIAVTDH